MAIIVVFFLFAWSAKSTLLKGETTWSAKSMPIKRNKSRSKKEFSTSLLEQISDQTSNYLGSDESINRNKRSQ